MTGDLPVPMILAKRVLDLFEESGTTAKEQNAALDILRTVVLERLYPTVADSHSMRSDESRG